MRLPFVEGRRASCHSVRADWGELVARIARFGLGAALTLSLAMVFAPPCRAQYTYGTWDGLETYTVTLLTINYQEISQITNTVSTTLTIEFDGLPTSLTLEGGLYMTDAGLFGPASAGPDGAGGLSGSIIDEMYPAGYAFAYFDAVPGSYADATYTSEYLDRDSLIFTDVSASFQTVPEPTTLIEATIAVISISVFVCARRLIARRSGASASPGAGLVSSAGQK